MKKYNVAFQGEKGAYGEMAVLQYFPNANLHPLRSFKEVFDTIKDKTNDFAVVPVENSIEGSVNETYDLLLQEEIKVSAEIFQRINHCLIVNKEHIEPLKKVYSHPQALAQCRKYLQDKKIEPIPIYDTAGAVKMIKENKLRDVAAIASKRASQIYDMKILDQGIEDMEKNYTRFFVISLNVSTRPSNNDRTSIIFSLNHVPGSLFSILKEFSNRQINLTRIESRPTKETPWEYYFYLDFDGHEKDDKISFVLKKIKAKTKYYKLLGSYKKGKLS
ncbi:MAG: prephenate dehydratase [Nitrososphaeraceae archaeon]